MSLLDPGRVADAEERARSLSRQGDDLFRQAESKHRQAQQIARTWGIDLCPVKHGSQCCGAYDLCERELAKTPHPPWEDRSLTPSRR